MLHIKRNSITSLSSIDILCIIVLVKETLWSYFRVVLSKIPIIGMLSNEITYIFIIGLIILSLSDFGRKLKPIDFIIYATFFVIYLLQYLIFPQNTDYLDKNFGMFFLNTLPLYFIGRTINYEKLSSVITLLSIISIFTITYTSFYYKGGDDFGGSYGGLHMNISFKLLPFLLLILIDAFNNKKIISICLSLYGFVLLLSLGNRGCVIYYTICLIYCLMYFLKKRNNINKSIVVIAIISIIIFLSYDLFFDSLYNILINKSGTSRIFTIIEENRFFEDSGRFDLVKAIFSSLSTNIFGIGLFGDRVLTGMYSHNIFVEILSSFGFFIGMFLIISLLFVLLKAYKYSFKSNHLFFISLVGFCFFPLMTSDSFLEYPYFYLLLGYSIKLIEEKMSMNKKELN